MAAYNSRNASNSRNESNSRAANTVDAPTIAGMLAKVMKPATACREAMDTIIIRYGSSSSRKSQQHSAGTPATAAEAHINEWQIFAVFISNPLDFCPSKKIKTKVGFLLFYYTSAAPGAVYTS
jgi:hypothetical protein